MASSCSDRVGRRPLMMTSHIGMAVSLLVTAAAACVPGKSAACCACVPVPRAERPQPRGRCLCPPTHSSLSQHHNSRVPSAKVCLHCAGDRFAIMAVSAMFCFIAFFSCGAGPLPFVIMSEMVGGFHIKAKVASVCTALNW